MHIKFVTKSKLENFSRPFVRSFKPTLIVEIQGDNEIKLPPVSPCILMSINMLVDSLLVLVETKIHFHQESIVIF